MPLPRWFEIARRFQALSQTGLAYTKDPYDRQRYMEIQRLAGEMMQNGASTTEPMSLVGIFEIERGYATPKVDVRAAVFHNDRILLVREIDDQGWSLPGGWADVGDSPSVAAVREVKEESGYEVTVKKLAAIYDRDKHGHPPIPFHAYKVFFVCELIGGNAKGSVETSDVNFFSEDELPPLSLGRVTPAQITHMFGHYRNPAWPTSYD